MKNEFLVSFLKSACGLFVFMAFATLVRWDFNDAHKKVEEIFPIGKGEFKKHLTNVFLFLVALFFIAIVRLLE
jgi:hypothetical protein